MHGETGGRNGGSLMSAVNSNNRPNLVTASKPNMRDDIRSELQDNSTFFLIIFSCTISIFLVD